MCATSGLILAVQALGAIALSWPEPTSRRSATFRSWRAASGSPPTRSPSPGRAPMRRRCGTTRARDGEGYVLDGGKRFITNAGVAGLYTVFAKTDPAAGHRDLLLRRRGRHARVRGRPRGAEDGDQGLDDRRARLRRLRVPAGNRVGEEGEGFRDRDARARPLAARGSRRRRSGWRRARPTTRSRTPRNARRSASRSRSTSWSRAMLADMETRCEAARGLLYRVGAHASTPAPTAPS